MKRLMVFKAAFVSAVLLFQIIPSVTAADGEPKRDIVLHKVIPTTRGIIEVPKASISHELLVVSFPSSGLYSLYIEDGMGNIVYTSTLPADGMEYTYDLSGIGEGTFTLILEGASGEYEGSFSV